MKVGNKKGFKHSEETKKKIKKALKDFFKDFPKLRGENHPNWKGGISIGENEKEYRKKYHKNRKEIHKNEMRKYRQVYREKELLQNRERRLKILQHYSEKIPKCACCGENHYEFLCLDHLNNDGAKHRKEIKTGGTSILNWIKRNNFPPMFQVLCHNCNAAKGIYKICPHQKEKLEN